MSAKFRVANKTKEKRSCKRLQTQPTGDSMTRQAHAAECDINNIMKRYQKDGVITHFAKYEGQYGDVTGLEFTNAMQTIATANSMFEDLPSTARAKFDNDPAKFLKYVEDPANLEEMRSTGLAKGRPENPASSEALNPDRPGTVNQPDLQAGDPPPAQPAETS